MKSKFWNFADSNDGRTLTICGPIAEEMWFEDDVTPKAFADELKAGKGDITLWINSPGGDCIAAAQIYNMLKDYNGSINVKIDGIAASAASVVAMAGDHIQISPLGMLMIHNPATIAMGDHNDMKSAIEMLNEVKESIINAYEIKTGMSRDDISELMENETWMNANRALELGFVDGIIGQDEEKEEEEPNQEPKEEPAEEEEKEKEEPKADEQEEEEEKEPAKDKELTNGMEFSVRKFNNNLIEKLSKADKSESGMTARERLELIGKYI